MFTRPSSNVVDAHGSYVAWADFDGNVPSLEELEEAGVPLPTLRVQSSIPGREHWYWRYSQFNNDIPSVQGINKAIAYALQADIGAWDAGHSTRPVGSYNHKRDAPVVIKAANDHTYRIADFASVPMPQNSYDLEQFRKEHIPQPVRTFMKHGPWSDEAIDLLTKFKVSEGSRSSALTRSAFECAERGLDNSEIYSLLQWVDKRWGKFANRENKEKYYVDLINYVRQKVPYEGIKDVTVLAESLQTYSFKEVVSYVDETDWIIGGILPYKGVAYIVGRPGTGKTTLALGMCTSLALAKQYLWERNEKSYKTLYLSLEMSIEDVNQFYNKLKVNYTDEEIDKLDEQFHTYASPEKIKFYQENSPILGKFLRTLENLKPDIVLVDSASYSLASNLSNQEEVTKSIELIDMIRDKYGVTFIFIHHARKDPPAHGYKEADLDDVFGSTFIAASASSIVSLKNSKEYTESNRLMDLKYLKTRFSGDNTGLTVVMDGERRMFKKPAMGELMAAPVTKTTTKELKKNGGSDKSFFSV
jgi:KaiC/GvpD/RAD55 family RecA-like ATPase